MSKKTAKPAAKKAAKKANAVVENKKTTTKSVTSGQWSKSDSKPNLKNQNLKSVTIDDTAKPVVKSKKTTKKAMVESGEKKSVGRPGVKSKMIREMFAQGKTRKEIATELNIAYQQVRQALVYHFKIDNTTPEATPEVPAVESTPNEQ